MDGWTVGQLDCWTVGRLEGWKVGRLEGWKVGKLESWKVGRLESWKVGKLDGWAGVRGQGSGVRGQGKGGSRSASRLTPHNKKISATIGVRLSVLPKRLVPRRGMSRGAVGRLDCWSVGQGGREAPYSLRLTPHSIKKFRQQLGSGFVGNISATLKPDPLGNIRLGSRR